MTELLLARLPLIRARDDALRRTWRFAAAVGLFALVYADVAFAAARSAEARCLALTIYWEARNGGRDSMVAVAWVILNRRRSRHFASTICGVVHSGGETPPCQFSYWCDGEPEVPQNAASWRLAREVADEMIADPPADPTHGALFFHAAGTPASWTAARKRTVTIGDQIFYR